MVVIMATICQLSNSEYVSKHKILTCSFCLTFTAVNTYTKIRGVNSHIIDNEVRTKLHVLTFTVNTSAHSVIVSS